MAENFWMIISNNTEETQEWWDAAKSAYINHPESVPEIIVPLLDASWGENEVLATRAEMKQAQVWAARLSGWKTNDGPLIFKK